MALSAMVLFACDGRSYELGQRGGAAGMGTGGSGASPAVGGTGAGADALGGAPDQTTGGSSVGGSTAGTSGGVIVGNTSISRIHPSATSLDLLLMIDNSIGMGDKQNLLAKSIASLAERFTRPFCLDANGNRTGSRVDGDGVCLKGAPEFPVPFDLHIGIITSSLGDHGSGDVCSDAQATANAANGEQPSNYNDNAQLIPSVRTVSTSSGDPTFLAWGPPDLSEPSHLIEQLQAVGEHGCGLEAQLESWYRFLVDPEPVSSMSSDTHASERGAVNQVVLAQRAAFLRPDSVLAVMMLSDENDCSILDEDGTQGWLVGYKGGVGMLNQDMPRATSACASDPNSTCCVPCGAPSPAGCPSSKDDSACAAGDMLLRSEDSLNLRCYRQKQRFGIDLLYPVSRYTQGLTARLIEPRMDGTFVANPIYMPGAQGTPARDPSMVYLAGIVGVPWQDVATPDALAGGTLTYMTASELAANGRWDLMLGDPDAGVAPTDPFMVESIDPRPIGEKHPLVDAAISDESTPNNPINGHEQAVLPSPDDLQFACTYQLLDPLSQQDCDSNSDVCECNSEEFDKHSPLCQGLTATASGAQVYGKGYPAVRELEVLKGIGSGAVVASICAQSVSSDDPVNDPSYGYNPAFAAIGDRVKASFGLPCAPEPLPVDADGRTTARVIQAWVGSDCSCNAADGNQPLDAADQANLPAIQQALQTLGVAPNACICQVTQLAGDALQACYGTGPYSPDAPGGFCYLDAELGLGDPTLVQSCPASERRRIRFSPNTGLELNSATFTLLPASGG